MHGAFQEVLNKPPFILIPLSYTSSTVVKTIIYSFIALSTLSIVSKTWDKGMRTAQSLEIGQLHTPPQIFKTKIPIEMVVSKPSGSGCSG